MDTRRASLENTGCLKTSSKSMCFLNLNSEISERKASDCCHQYNSSSDKEQLPQNSCVHFIVEKDLPIIFPL